MTETDMTDAPLSDGPSPDRADHDDGGPGNSEGISCVIYKSPRKAEMYLYLRDADDFSQVPEALMKSFGEPQRVMDLTLSAGRRLARADVAEVMAGLRGSGFYLQMPPTADSILRRDYLGDGSVDNPRLKEVGDS
ncbi:MAG: YcgL domain-containing protein [Gammaproteobacteria bacterium]